MSADTPEPVPNEGKAGEVKWVEYLSGPREARITLWGHDLQYEIGVSDSEDDPRVVELLIRSTSEARPITQRDLRRIPLERLNGAARVFVRGGFLENPEFAWTHFGHPEKHEPQKPGPRGYDDDFYAEIARLARDAKSMKVSARQHISHNKQVGVHTADKWLKECRKRGILVPGELRR
ncbi:hypothetical protein [Nocardia sp. alder85J]|uniref:hypothetical protein n=1 Tax=Nocardia sp. alder85J TaxID=2862949 RepID=UPI001CD1FDF7|nr:hypothetical protein [Nocardia sp. alder85J]MCX4097607.1 hypothetical protein [Nocardia sp. alder85J]